MRLTDATRVDLKAVEKSLARWQSILENGYDHDPCALCKLDQVRGTGCKSCVLEILMGNDTFDFHICCIITDEADTQHRGHQSATYPQPLAQQVIRVLSYLRNYLTAYLNNEDMGE